MSHRVVGRVKDAHGLKGELWVVLFSGQCDWLDALNASGEFHLRPQEGSDEGARRFALKGARRHKNGVILQSSDLRDRTQAEAWRGHFLQIPESFLVAGQGETYFLAEIEGFEVWKADASRVGPIIGFSTNGLQDLLQVRLSGGEIVEIPFVEDFVERIDSKERRIYMQLPPGLFEAQLGNEASDEGPESDSLESDDE
ncbi:MAG TPA: ribosome maturation factor RimM [Pseudobdellovibrionaceae bacterium]|nr:ribosome maturation factor RimM [Pseudobdellovibrionaceae bacterium]